MVSLVSIQWKNKKGCIFFLQKSRHPVIYYIGAFNMRLVVKKKKKARTLNLNLLISANTPLNPTSVTSFLPLKTDRSLDAIRRLCVKVGFPATVTPLLLQQRERDKK